MGVPGLALRFGAGLFLTIALIGIWVNVFSPATESAKAAQSEFSNTTTELKDQKYLIYDNTTVSGSQVLNALRKFENEAEDRTIALYVETGKNNGAGVWYYSQFASDEVTESTTDDLDLATDATDNNYINPTGMFQAGIERDNNGVIRAIRFVQQ